MPGTLTRTDVRPRQHERTDRRAAATTAAFAARGESDRHRGRRTATPTATATTAPATSRRVRRIHRRCVAQIPYDAIHARSPRDL